MIIETKNPIAPKMSIPIAEIFATDQNSFFDGFFKESHTLLDFAAKDLKFS